MHIQRPYEEATRVNLFYNPECPLWMPGFELLILQFSKEQSFWTFTTKYVCMVSCSVQFINRFDQKYGMWPLGYKKKRRIVTRNYDVVVFGDHGNNALPLSIPELDLIGGVARGLAEGRSVLARSKPGYVKRFDRFKQYAVLLVNLTKNLKNKMYLYGPTQKTHIKYEIESRLFFNCMATPSKWSGEQSSISY